MRHLGFWTLIVLSAGGFAGIASAADVSWVTVGDGLWSDGANWSSGSPPAAGDRAILGDVGVPYVVTFRGAATVAEVQITSADATLWVNGVSGLHATLTTTGDVTNAGTIRLETTGTSSAIGSSVSPGAATLVNLGTILVNEGSDGRSRGINGNFTNSGSVAVQVNASLTITNAGRTFRQSGGTFTNDGTTTVNNGAVIFEGGTFTGVEPILNAVALTLATANAGALRIWGASTLTGDISAAQALWINGVSGLHATLTTTGDVTNAGTIRLETSDTGSNIASQWVSGAATLTNAGTIVVNEGSNGTMRGISGNFTNSGSVAVQVNASLTITNAGRTFRQSGGTFTNDGTTTVNNGAVIFEGGTFTGVEPILNAVALTLATSNAATLRIWGASTLTGDISAAQALWVNGVSGLHATLTTTGDVTNAGTIRLETSDTGSNIASQWVSGTATLVNLGTILVNEGSDGRSRGINGNFTNSGTVSVEVNATLTITNAGRTFRQSGGTFTNDGTTTVNNGAVIFEGGTFTGVEPILNAVALTLATANAAALRIWGASTLTGNISAAQALWVNGVSGLHATLTTTGDVTNAGTIRLETSGTGSNIASQLIAAPHTFTNENEIQVNAGSNGASRTLSGQIDNQGVIAIAPGASLFIDGGLTNAGDLSVAAGSSPDITGQFLQTAAGRTLIEIGGPLVTEYSRVRFGTAAVLDGELNVSHVNSYDPPDDAEFEVVRYRSTLDATQRVFGGFAAITGDDGDYVDTYAANVVRLNRIDGPCPTRLDGDVDGDRDVDLADLAILLAGFGRVCGP